MKKLFVIILAALTLYSCQKKENDSMTVTQEVVFAPEWVNPDGLKSTNDDPAFPCSNLSADYAWVKINGNDYFPDLYELSGQMYTQAIKIDVPSGGQQPIQISQFWLMHDNGAGNGPDGIPVMGTPMDDSEYHVYVNTPLSFTYTVEAFTKAEIPIQVLCVQQQNIEGFGFDWFGVSEIVVREKCFFGDVCLDGDPYKPADFESEEYGTNLGIDIPAIMRIRVEQNGEPVPYSPFYNISWKGIGDPLCIQYPDNLEIDGELTRIFLDILVPDDIGDMVYVNYAQFTIVDDGPVMYNGNPIAGLDNVVDIVLGNCSYADADIELGWKSAPCGQIGLVGEFNNWGLDIPPIPDHNMERQINPNNWMTTIVLSSDDDSNGDEIIEIKFRQNQNWDVNWGGVGLDSNGWQDGPNIFVPLTTSPITYYVYFDCETGNYIFQTTPFE